MRNPDHTVTIEKLAESIDAFNVIVNHRQKPKQWRIRISSKHGYWIESLDFSEESRKVRHMVVDWHPVQQGIQIPKTITVDSPPLKYTRTVHLNQNNHPINDDAFKINILEGAFVSDLTGPRPKVHIWGRSAPARTFDSYEDYKHWVDSEVASARSPRPPRQSRLRQFLRPSVFLILGLLLLFILRRLVKSKVEKGEDHSR